MAQLIKLACASFSPQAWSALFLVPAFLLLPLGVHAQPPEASGADLSVNRMSTLDNTRPLEVGDSINYRVVEDRGEAVTLPVTDSGDVEIPMAGRVRAVGKTPRALAREVKQLLEKTLYQKATVVVGLAKATTAPLGKVYISGQVASQGSYEIPRGEPLSVARLIIEAGGFADFADKRRVRVVRQGSDGNKQRITVDVKDVLEKGEIEKDLVLEPGDFVHVPERFINF